MKIALTGTRGIPASYGGFETFAEELSTRLAASGHEVIVYGRTHAVPAVGKEYRGVKIKLLPTIRQKYLDTPVNALLSFCHLLLHPVDVVLVCNAANSPFIWLLRLARLPVVLNVDGIERRRAKWGLLGRLWYWLGEWCAVLCSSCIVSDAQVIYRYYKERYRCESRVITYGCRQAPEALIARKKRDFSSFAGEIVTEEIFQELKVQPGQYLLYVSRLEPENNAHVLISAYAKLDEYLRRKHPLLIVGDAPYAASYIASLKAGVVSGVLFAGYRFGRSYELLQQGALLYVQATEVGGTHPALVEAMGYANCIVANDTPENREVLGEAGCYYRKNEEEDLAEKLRNLLDEPEKVKHFRQLAHERALLLYNWDSIKVAYEELFRSLIGTQVSSGS